MHHVLPLLMSFVLGFFSILSAAVFGKEEKKEQSPFALVSLVLMALALVAARAL